MKKLLLLALCVVAFTACRAEPQDAVVGKLRALFPRADRDRDGQLSVEEQRTAVDYVKQNFGDDWSQRIGRMFTRAAGSDLVISGDEWKQQVDAFARPVAKTTQMLAMRDGVKLATDLYLPPGEGPFPVILSRTPYGRKKHNESADGFARGGFAFVSQDMRGRFDSEGENLPFIGCGWGEHQDGVDTLAWIRQQPWCNGKVGTIGGSAGGITQNLLAGAAPDGLAAQYISVAPADMYSGSTYIGGAFRKADVEEWMTHNRFDPRALAIARAHPSYDDYWRAQDTSTRFGQMKVPAVLIGGWFDMFAQGTIDQFVGRQQQGAGGSRGAQKLIMGPWHHGVGQMPCGELTFPNAKTPPQYGPVRWFEHYLSGADNGIEKEPAVAYYVMGDTATPGAPGNEWRYADVWPIPAQETPVFLTADKRLTLDAPTAADAKLTYTFDPANPCPTIGGHNLTIARGSMDQRRIEGRADALVFTSDVLDHPVEVTGRLTARLFVASSAVDTDLSVRLCDVYPDGRSMLIAEGMQRLRYRQSREQPQLLTPGQVEEVAVDCWSTSIVFNRGHRVRVTITSSNYPRFDVNPGTGQPWSDTAERVPQTNTIRCDAAHPSRLIVPIIPPAKVARGF